MLWKRAEKCKGASVPEVAFLHRPTVLRVYTSRSAGSGQQSYGIGLALLTCSFKNL